MNSVHTHTHTCTLINNEGNYNISILQFTVIKLRYKLLVHVYSYVYLFKQYDRKDFRTWLYAELEQKNNSRYVWSSKKDKAGREYERWFYNDVRVSDLRPDKSLTWLNGPRFSWIQTIKIFKASDSVYPFLSRCLLACANRWLVWLGGNHGRRRRHAQSRFHIRTFTNVIVCQHW